MILGNYSSGTDNTHYCSYCGRNCSCNTFTIYAHSSNNYHVEYKKETKELLKKEFYLERKLETEEGIAYCNFIHSKPLNSYKKIIPKWYYKGTNSFRYSPRTPIYNFQKRN